MLFNIKSKLMKYTEDTTNTARTYNLDPRDVLFCYLVAAGADRAESYFVIYDHGTNKTCKTLEQARTKANDFFSLNPGAAVLVQRIKNKKPLNTSDAKRQAQTAEQENETKERQEQEQEEIKKFSNKSYIIAQLAKEAKNQSGKERANILMQIADLQRMKQEETKQDEEKRLFYLPFVSSCRSCKLVKLFQDLSK